MKKLLYLSVAFGLLALGSCKKKETGGTNNGTSYTVAPNQNSVIIYFGGTWCAPCGAYGKPAKETIKNANPDVTILSCQLNSQSVTDPMNNTDANALATSFGISSVPTMYVGANNGLIKGYVGNGIVASSVQADINANKALTPKAASKFTVTLSGDDMTVNTTTEFYADQTEEYYIAAYVTEDGLSYTQASDGSVNKNIHDNVIRKNITPVSSFGEILKAAPTKGVVTKTLTGTLSPLWNKDKCKLHIVLWKKGTDGKYSISNGVSGKIK